MPATQNSRPVALRVKSYAALILLFVVVLLITLALSHGFRDELLKTAKDRINSPFIVESLVLCLVLYIAGSLIGCFAWKEEGNEYVLKNELAKEVLSEIPRAAYLLGTVTSATMICLSAVSLLWDDRQGFGIYLSSPAVGYALFSVVFALVFGAWGVLLEDFVLIPFFQSAKILTLLIAFSLLAAAVPPIAPLFFLVWLNSPGKKYRKKNSATHMENKSTEIS